MISGHCRALHEDHFIVQVFFETIQSIASWTLSLGVNLMSRSSTSGESALTALVSRSLVVCYDVCRSVLFVDLALRYPLLSNKLVHLPNENVCQGTLAINNSCVIIGRSSYIDKFEGIESLLISP